MTTRFLLDNPSIWKSKTVIYFGSGFGVLSVAAALTGADSVVACNSDADARAAILENAKLNQLKSIEVISNLTKLTSKPDVFVASDVLYDRENLGTLEISDDYCDLALYSGFAGPRPWDF